VALIEVAHPKFRATLFDEAKALGYIPAGQTLQNLRAYPVEEELTVSLKDQRQVLLRPARSTDGEAIRDLFHQLPKEDVYTRFFRTVRGLSAQEVQRLCNLNFETEVAFVASTGPREDQRIVAQACYFIDPSTNLAETAFMVHPQWQGTGLGSALQKRLMRHAQSRGVRGFVATVLPSNNNMIRLASAGSAQVNVTRENDTVKVTVLF
jgi:RimJ/RimL family protein N-acetyltransferase